MVQGGSKLSLSGSGLVPSCQELVPVFFRADFRWGEEEVLACSGRVINETLHPSAATRPPPTPGGAPTS